MDLSEILAAINEQGDAWKQYKADIDRTVQQMSDQLARAQARDNRIALGGGSDPDGLQQLGQPAYELITKEGKRYPALTKAQRVADYLRSTGAEDEDKSFSLGQFVRDSMFGRKVSSGPALVPTLIGANIIDDVRAVATLIQAGAITIPIDGPTNIAKIIGDPTVVQHAEATTDITESSPTFAPVSLNPGTLAALVPVSYEVVEDSPNLDAAMNRTLSAAFAQKLDTLGLATVLADAAIPKNALPGNPLDPKDFVKVALAVKDAMNANQPVPDACIVNAGDFVTRHSVLATGSGTWLGKPPFLSGMREFPTTSIAAGTSLLGGFQRGAGVALRMGLSVQMVRYGKPTSGMHYLVAVMRAAAVVLQPKALFKQLLA